MSATERRGLEQRALGTLFGPPELQEAARALAKASARGQGLPPRVADRDIIERVARLARQSDRD